MLRVILGLELYLLSQMAHHHSRRPHTDSCALEFRSANIVYFGMAGTQWSQSETPVYLATVSFTAQHL